MKWVVVNYETENEVWSFNDKEETARPFDSLISAAKSAWGVVKFFL